jgi:hypothetical protein
MTAADKQIRRQAFAAALLLMMLRLLPLLEPP